MTGLPEFVLDRIREREAMAKVIHTATCTHETVLRGTPCLPSCQQPAGVLADCEAKRRLVDWAAPVCGDHLVPTDRPGVYDTRPLRYATDDGEDVLRYLALPYADHPDYEEEWKP